MQDNFNIHGWHLKQAIQEIEKTNNERIYMGEEKGQCPECGCKMEAAMCNECGYMEEATFTNKHDDNPELKGGQKDLPDELQAKIVAKEGHSSLTHVDKIDAVLDNLLRNVSTDSTIPTRTKEGLLNAFKEIQGHIEDLGFELEVDNDELNEGMDHEVSMAQNSLESIINSASQLIAKLGNDERDIPGWIQDHIAKSENYIEQANQSFHELEPSIKDVDTDIMNEESVRMFKSDNPEGDTLVLRFLQGIAKKFDYPVAQAALFVKDRIKKLGY